MLGVRSDRVTWEINFQDGRGDLQAQKSPRGAGYGGFIGYLSVDSSHAVAAPLCQAIGSGAVLIER